MPKTSNDYGRQFGYRQSYFGANTKGHDVKAFGDTTSKYIFWDASLNKFIISGTLDINGTSITATASEINRIADTSARIVDATGSTLAVTEASHDGKVITLNRAAGIAVTLPAATGSGTKLKFIVGTTVTSNTTTIKVTGNDTMTGVALMCADGGNTINGWETASDSDTITFDGSTTGGIKGDAVELIDIATDLWYVKIIGSSTGSEATPFSATVT